MYLGIRSFNYNNRAYAAFAVMDTNEKELKNFLKMVSFEPDTDPNYVYLYIEDPALVKVAEDLGWKLFDTDIPDIVRRRAPSA